MSGVHDAARLSIAGVASSKADSGTSARRRFRAMMFPAAAPMILLFRRVATQRQASGDALVPTWIFVTGYLLV
jgi:predicted metal-binding membrane protein